MYEENDWIFANFEEVLVGASEGFTSSVQSASSGEYFLDIYRTSPATDTDAEPQFAIAHGHLHGSGSTTLEGQSVGKTFGAAIYGQFAALLENKDDDDTTFTINGAASTSSIFIKVYRNRMRERLDAGNWQLDFSGSNGKMLQLVDKITMVQ